ncbi:Tox-REase-5 domain-containing protein [Teredinibacter franksiae]|uniref:Tox-REase-5 domain-containing protein n=1 Tax=Teredinibacter franksiae TaxID=2761453 RepID=UPI001623889A|nr:Tox-REase-5 domain-containing protein [Teredinibacter franksiae]
MVAIVAGNGLGLLNGSAINVGSAGTFGQGSLGQAGSATVNLSTGNLLLQFNDEQITGTGSDLLASRTYNALGGVTDGDGDRWRWSGEKKVVQSGSNVIRTTGDGHEAVYTWNGSAYVSNTGSGAHDKITKVGSEWIWEEGSSKTVERYNTSTGWIKNVRDTSGNGFDYTFSGSKLTKVRDIGSGQELQFVYGSNGKVSQLKTRTEYAGSIKTLQQVYYTYDSYNRLSVVKVDLTPDNNSISDNKIFSTTYGYDGSSTRVTSVSHNDGTSANITYTYHGGAYKVRTVTDASGTTTFTYGTNQTTVSNGTGDAWVYSYDSNKQLTSVTSALVDGVTQKVSYTYYNGEVKTVTDGFNKTVTYVYDSNGNRTSETDTQGNTVTRLFSNNLLVNESRTIDGVTQTDRFVYDSARRLRYTVSAEGRVSENRYDSNGNVTSSREYTGTTASYAYQVINLGGEKNLNDLATFDIDEVWEMTLNINGTSRFFVVGAIGPDMSYQDFITAMNAQLNPYGASMALAGGNLIFRTASESSSASISLTGGSGYFSAYIAGYTGLDPAVSGRSSSSGLYSVGGLASTTTLSESQLNSWANSQQKSAVQLTAYSYDHLGRLTHKTAYAEVNSAGAGILNHAAEVTQYVYSEYGQLLSTIAKRGSGHNVSTTLTSMVYDGMGRLTSKVGSSGTETTSYGYRAITTSSNTSGLSVTQSFDGRGRLDFVTSRASGETSRLTEYYYDGAGRLMRTDDESLGSSYVFYNKAGQVKYKVDSHNRAEGFTYNQNGQVIKEVQYYNAFNHVSKSVSANNTYDIETRYGYNSNGLLETVTKENGGSDIAVTTAYDSASRKVKETQGSRVTRYFYDKDGLLKGVLNAEGYLSENVYDAVGRLSRTVRYETEVTGSTFASGTLTSVRSVADNGTELYTHYYYDAQGRQIGVVDEQGFLTETLFEPALSQTHTIKYFAPVSVSISDSFLDVKLKAGAGGQVATHTHFDSYGRVSKVVSPDGTETQSIYDSAGRLARTVEKVATKRMQSTGLTFEDSATSSWSINNSYWRVNSGGTSSYGTGPSVGSQGSTSYIYMETSGGQANAAGNAGQFVSDFFSVNGSNSVSFDYHMFGSNMGTLALDVYVVDPKQRGDQYVYHGYQTINIGGDKSGDDIVFDKLDDSFDFTVYVNGSAQQVSFSVYEDEVHTYNSLIGMINADLTGASAALVDGNLRISSDRTGTSSKITLANFGAYDADLRSELDGYTGLSAEVSGNTGYYNWEYARSNNVWSKSGQQQTSNTDAWKSATVDLSQFEGDIKLRFRGVAVGGYMGDMAVDNIAVHSSIFEERVTHNRYNAFGEVTGVVSGEGSEGLAASPTGSALNTAITNYGQSFSYDGMGRKISETGPDGQKTLFFYDKTGRPTYTVNALGEATQTVYNGLGQATETRVLTNRISISGFVGGRETSTLTTRVNNAKNNTTDNVVKQTYNKLGLQHITTDAQEFTTEKTYNSYGELYRTIRKITSGTSNYTYHYYDLLGRETRTYSNGVNNYTNYDAFGRVSGVRDGNGNWTNTAYNYGGREVVVTDAAGKSNTTTYDAYGRTLTSKDAYGNVTTYQYDDKQNAVTVTTPSGASVTTWSNADGDTLQLRDGNGYVTYYNYNKDGQLESVKDHNRNTISQKTYDDSGRLKDVIDGNGRVTRFSYDAANRTVMEAVDPDGSLNLRTSYTFDGQGRQFTVTKGYGSSTASTTEYRYYADGQVKQIIVDPTGLKLSTQFSYDGLGNTLTVEQGTVSSSSQRKTQYTYDNLGRKTSEVIAPGVLNITTQYKYDLNGNMTRMINARGHSTWFVYNNLNQKIADVNAAGGVTKYEYDDNGRLHHTRSYVFTVNDETSEWGDVVTSYEVDYDAYDRRSYNVYGEDGRVSYVVTAQADDAWMVSESRYDGNGNVVALVQFDKTLTNQIITNMGVQLTETELKNALSGVGRGGASLGDTRITRYEYDALNRQVKTILPGYFDPNSGRVWSTNNSARFERTIEVTYDGAGNEVRNQIRTGQSDYSYQYKTYDAANRMVHDIDGEKGVTKNTYDTVGNITHVTRYNSGANSEPSRGYYLPADNVVSASSTYDRVIINQYDAAGRKTKTTMPTSRLSTYATNGGGTLRNDAAVTEFQYNAMGEKVKQRVQTDSSVWRDTYYYYDAVGRQAMEVNAKGQATKTEYDGMGNVTRTVQLYYTTSPSSLNTTSAPSVSEHSSYDRVTRFTYDSVGRNTYVYKDNTTYTTSQNSVATSNRDGLQVQRNVYNAFGDVYFQQDAAGSYSYHYFNRDGQEKYSYSPHSTVTRDYLDPFSSVNSSARVYTTLTYNAFGELSQQVQSDTYSYADARTSTITYDHAGNAISSTDAEGGVHTQEFDVAGHVTAEQTVIGGDVVRKEFTYDKTGRQTAALDVFTLNGAEHKAGKRTTHNKFGDVTHEYTVSGVGGGSSQLTTYYYYDRSGQMYYKRDAQNYHYYRYDLTGEVVRETSLGHNTYYQRDELGRVTKEIKPSFQGLLNATNHQNQRTFIPVVTQEYDRWGNIVKSIISDNGDGANSRVTEYRYDHNDQVIEEILPSISRMAENGTTANVKLHKKYHYDKAGRLIRQAEGVNGSETNVRKQYFYTNGNVYQEIDATGVKKEYRYNVFNEKVATRDGVGNVMVHDYDRLGQLTATSVYMDDARYVVSESTYTTTSDTTYSTSTNTFTNINYGTRAERVLLNSYDYDAVGRRTKETTYSDSLDSVGASVRYVYDERGKKLQTIDQLARSTYYTYDSQGNKTEERFAIGSSLDNITKWTYNTTSSYKTGQMTTKTAAGGRLTNYYYDPYGRLITERYNSSTNTQRSYTYLSGTMLQSIVKDTNNWSNFRGYNNSVRTSNYAYDFTGNRVSEEIIDDNNWNYTSTYTVTSDYYSSTSTYTNTFSGSTQSKVVTRSLYDDHNRLIKVTSPEVAGNEGLWDERASLTSLEYSYDEFGNRRRVHAVYQKPNSNYNDTETGWYRYDGEGRALVANGEYSSDTGRIEAKGAKSYAYQYDGAGRVSQENQWTKSGISTRHMNISTFNSYLNNSWGGNVNSAAAQAYFGGEVISYNVDTYTTTSSDWSSTYTYTYTEMKVVVDKGDHYTQRTYAYDDLGHRTASDKKTVRIRDGVQVYTGSTTADFRAVYDNRGLKKSHTAYDSSGNQQSRSTSTYTKDGKLAAQTNYDKNNRKSGYTSYINGYDGAGNVARYTYSHYDNGSYKFKYTYTQTYSFVNGENYLQKNTKVERSNGGWKPGHSSFKYDIRGNLSSVSIWGGESGKKSFIYDNDGKILAKSETVDGRTTKDTYFYQAGNRLGSVGNRTVDLMPSVQMAGGTAPGSYTVSGGETLHGLAQSLYGDSNLWYLIADANGLALGPGEQFKSSDSGMLLEIPSVDASLQNKADNFKPYNPGEIIGDTTPSPQAPPPPSSSCNALLTIVMVVVAVIVTVYTAGAAAGLMANAAAVSGGTMTAGAAMSAGVSAGLAATAAGNVGILMAASAIGGFMGSIASQAVGVAGGAQDRISFKQAFTEGAVSGLTAGIGKGFGAAAKGASQTTQYAYKAGNIAANYVASHAVKKIAGMDVSFSWKGMAASVAGSMVSSGGDSIVGQTVGGFVSGAITAKLSDQWGVGPKADYGQIALNSFASALGNSVVEKMKSGSGSNVEKRDKIKADQAKVDQAVEHLNAAATGSAAGGKESSQYIRNANGDIVTPEQAGMTQQEYDQYLEQYGPDGGKGGPAGASAMGMAAAPLPETPSSPNPRSPGRVGSWPTGPAANDGNFNFKKGVGLGRSLGARLLGAIGLALHSSKTAGPETWTNDGIEYTRNDDTGRLSVEYGDGEIEYYGIGSEGEVWDYDYETGASITFGVMGDDGGFAPITDQDDIMYRSWAYNNEGSLADWVSLGRPGGSGESSLSSTQRPMPPGNWESVNESMSDSARAYQTQISGRANEAYVVNGVKFDGVTPDAYLDAKGPNYANFLNKDGEFQGWWRGSDKLADQAVRQLDAAGDVPIQWHFAESDAADATRTLLSERDIFGIDIMYTPPSL